MSDCAAVCAKLKRWAEKSYGIGSGPWGGSGELDLADVVIASVNRDERVRRIFCCSWFAVRWGWSASRRRLSADLALVERDLLAAQEELQRLRSERDSAVKAFEDLAKKRGEWAGRVQELLAGFEGRLNVLRRSSWLWDEVNDSDADDLMEDLKKEADTLVRDIEHQESGRDGKRAISLDGALV